MSYLLKALQKAEEERQSNLHSDDSETVVVERRAVLPKSLLFIVVVFLLLTVWQLIKSPVDVPNELESQDVHIEDVPANDLMVANLPKENAKPVVESQDASKNTFVGKPKDLSELSSIELAMIPSLDLASHIYSSAIDYRSVVINGQTYRQGMLISPGLKLEEINKVGIVINIQGQRVELPKGISWVASQDAK